MSKTEIDNDTRGLRIATAAEVWRTGARGLTFADPGHIYGRIEQDNKGVIVANNKEGQKKYRGSFDSLSYKTKQYIFDRFNNGEKSNKAVYLVKRDPNWDGRPGVIYSDYSISKVDGKIYNNKTGELFEPEKEKKKLEKQAKVEQPKAKKSTKKGAKK